MSPTRSNRPEYQRALVDRAAPSPMITVDALVPVYVDQATHVDVGVLVGWQRWSQGWYGHVGWFRDGQLHWAWVSASRLAQISPPSGRGPFGTG